MPFWFEMTGGCAQVQKLSVEMSASCASSLHAQVRTVPLTEQGSHVSA